jgi:hypothetical protein
MELTEKTLQVLKNFASINPNVVLNEGNIIRTVSEGKTILSRAALEQEFDRTVGIYDLNQLLTSISLVDGARIKFEEHNMLISDTTGRSRIKYFYSDLDNLTKPSKDIVMPETNVTFTLTKDTLSKVKRAASAFGHTEMSVSVVDKVVSLAVIDSKDSTSHVFSIDVEGEYDVENFSFVYKIDNLRMLEGDYDVNISSRLISHFINKNFPIEYWVALEKSSHYGAA